MKKTTIILTGVLSPLFYHLVFNFMLYLPYSEKLKTLQNVMLFVLPAIPGIAIAFLLVKNTFKEFLKSLIICFLLSVVVELIYSLLDVDMIIFRHITGYEEMYYGEAVLFIVTYSSYIISCLVGSIVSGSVTLFKQIMQAVRKKRKNNEVY